MSTDPDNSPPAGDDHLEELMVRYWDGNLEEEGLAELNAALASRPDLRAAFQDMSLQILGMSERGAAERAAAPFDRTRVLAMQRAGNRRRFLWSAAAAASVFVAAGGLLIRWFLGGRVNLVIAHIRIASGIVQVGNVDAPMTLNLSLAAGEEVATLGVDSSAEILLVDGTRLILGGNTSITLPDVGGSILGFLRGILAAEVQSRPESQPLVFVTPAAEVKANDSKLVLTGSDSQTAVGVFKTSKAHDAGKVEMKRLSDKSSVNIKPGEWALADRQGNMRPKALTQTPDTYRLNFGATLPEGWGAGELVPKAVGDDLPDDSEGAVRAVQVKGPRTMHHVIRSNNAWTKGLFEIHDDSRFHFRFRIDKPGFFHLLVVARGQDPTRHPAVVWENFNFFRNRKPGVWYTVDVPFADFKPTRKDIVLDKPLVAFQVVFDSLTVDRGLMVDRFWVTRGPEEGTAAPQ